MPDPLQNAFQTLDVKGVSRTRSSRIRTSMRRRAMQGLGLGKPPYGYRIGAKGALEVVPRRSPRGRADIPLAYQRRAWRKADSPRTERARHTNAARRQMEHGHHPRHPAELHLHRHLPPFRNARAEQPRSHHSRARLPRRPGSHPRPPSDRARGERPTLPAVRSGRLRLLRQQHDGRNPGAKAGSAKTAAGSEASIVITNASLATTRAPAATTPGAPPVSRARPWAS